jgi:hypothetical protein
MKKRAPEQDMEELGQTGGMATLKKKGREFFSRISKMRKTFAGGRPRKHPLPRKKKS